MFEELDYQQTPLGNISLRRRPEPRLDNIVLYEVKLNDEFLMSSLFTESEIQLAKLGLAALAEQGCTEQLQIVVGGLGLGYTAVATLEEPAVESLLVVDVMQPVIDWHERGVVPLGAKLTADKRCTLQHADFFALAAAVNTGFYPDTPEQLADAVFLDIDHSPEHCLNPANERFYTLSGLHSLAAKLQTNGVFALWSNDPVDPRFTRLLEQVFRQVIAHTIRFPNPYTHGESSCTVYIAYQ